MKREQLEELDEATLREKAAALGVDIHQRNNKGTIIDKLLANHADTDDKPKKQANAAMPPLGALYDLAGNRIESRMWKLKIFSTETDKNDVDLIVNSHNIRVKRDVEVIVAEPYIEVLRNAVIETVRQDQDTQKRIPMQIQQYPHQAQPV